MDIKTIRRQNLADLISRYDSKREFSEAVDMSPSHVSQLSNAHRNIGDEVARNIEKGLHLPEGWMDTTHDDTDLAKDPRILALIKKFAAASEQGKQTAEAVLTLDLEIKHPQSESNGLDDLETGKGITERNHANT